MTGPLTKEEFHEIVGLLKMQTHVMITLHDKGLLHPEEIRREFGRYDAKLAEAMHAYFKAGETLVDVIRLRLEAN